MATMTTSRNNTSFPLHLFEFFKQAKWGHEYDFLKYYQNITRVYVTERLAARGVLIYYSMGLGKSLIAVAIAMELIKERQPIILLTKSLQENMRGAFVKYVAMRRQVDPEYALGRLSEAELSAWMAKNVAFVSMNASNMLKQMGRAVYTAEEFDAALEKRMGEVLKLPSLDGKLLIVDEAHNIFRAITNGSKNAQGLYDMVMRAKNLKIVFLTGTPIANDPFELVPCFNMLAGAPLLPESYKEFVRYFVDEKTGRVKNRGKFQNRLFGLVSYVSHKSAPGKAFGVVDPATRAEFPEERPMVVERVPMDVAQYVTYQLARDKEKEEEGGSGGFLRKGPGLGASAGITREAPSMTKPKSKASSTYRVKSRQLSNFCPEPAFRDAKDPSVIPAASLGSAKYRRIYANIEAHSHQLGIVYSQFVGMGGLGTFARYLETQGWVQLQLTRTESHLTPTEAITQLEDGEVGEQGELDEYDEASAVAASPIVPVSTEDSPPAGDGTPVATGSGDVNDIFLTELEAEMAHLPRVWRHVEDDPAFYGSADAAPGSTDGVAGFSLADALVDGAETSPVTVTFRYATGGDLPTLQEINKELTALPTPPHYILLVLEDACIAGYVVVHYADMIASCVGVITEEHLDGLNEDINRAALRKAIADTIDCTGNTAGFRKAIWGAAADTSGAHPTRASSAPVRRFAVISGAVPVEDRARLQDMFNDMGNVHGGVIDLILLSSTGAEGLDLHHVRHIHIMEPYWNWGRVMQIVARGVRNDSHKGLPPDEKNVTPYIYLAVPPAAEGSIPTTDTELYDAAVLNQVTIESFNDALKEVSIECRVNDEPHCRMCNPTSAPLFTDDIGRDIQAEEPCTEMREETLKAASVVVNGVEYYYVADPEALYDYRVFAFDPQVNGYRPLKESADGFEDIIEAIVARAGR